MKNIKLILAVLTGLLLIMAFTGSRPQHDFASYSTLETACYDRETEPYTTVVDSHLHFQGFGGKSLPFTELTQYLRKSGVKFANINGIGQILPENSGCTYYLDCPGTPVHPSTKNDFINAENYLKHKPKDIHLTLSMTFPDLAAPEGILDTMRFYDEKYPNMFKWMGEVNLIKQALLKNKHEPATIKNIHDWAPFMAELAQRNIPINIHSDLGNDDDFTQFLPLMKEVLVSYPDNKIVWAHMGLSKELVTMPASEHIAVMREVLDEHPNLMLDISWRIISDNYYSLPESRELYVAFFNEYFDRILPGTDFVASAKKTYDIYHEELMTTSDIFKDLDNNAFRHIALGENYFRLLELPYYAPQVCE